MNSFPVLKTVTFLPARRDANSSTEFSACGALQCFKSSAKQREKVRLSGEVCLLTKACRDAAARSKYFQPVDAFGERKESVICGVSLAEIPNRKERLNSAFAPLLIHTNTSGIGLFADQQRQQSVAADEVVMDRGAECTAGGCDVI